MGLIVSRGFALTFLTYVGAVIGYFNVLWLYPATFSPNELGLFRLLQDTAFLFVPFTTLGAGQGLIKYFPQITNQHNKSRLVGISLLWAFAGLSALFVLYAIFKIINPSWLAGTRNSLGSYAVIVMLLLAILNCQTVLESAGRAYLHFRFVGFCKDVLLRIFSGTLVGLYFLNYLTFEYVVIGLPIIYAVILIIIALYLFNRTKVKISWPRNTVEWKSVPTDFYTYGLVTMLGAAGSSLILRSDSFMVGIMAGYTLNSIYTTAFYIAVIAEIPRRTIAQVAVPILSTAFEKKDYKLIKDIYQKSSLNLLIICGLMYLGIICNLHNVFAMMPNGTFYSQGYLIVVIIGLGKVLDMTAGLNSEVLVMSPYYRQNLYLTIILGVTNIALNYLLIPIYGIRGAALATISSVILFNTLKFLYLYKKLGMQPFSSQTFKALLILISVAILGYSLPNLLSPYADIAYRSTMMVVLFTIGMYTLKPSVELEKLRLTIIQKVTKA